MKYYERIREIREAQHLTQQKVADLLHIGQRTYSDYESGKTRIPVESLLILARYYDVALKALEEVTGEKYDTLNIIGGGSQNKFLNAMTKKLTGKKIIAGPAEGTAIGNLMMQMVGCGDIADVKEGRQIIKNSFDINEVK